MEPLWWVGMGTSKPLLSVSFVIVVICFVFVELIRSGHSNGGIVEHKLQNLHSLLCQLI